MQFEYYVLNYDCNKKCVEHFNVFRNINVQERTEKEIKKYLRNPKLEKWDCYKQCEPNIEMITRECIWQYKQQLKNNN